MKHIVIKPLCILAWVAASLIGSAHASAWASDPDIGTVSAKAKKKSGSRGQIRFLPGSAETSKERSSRLRRECKGGVNAGACAGYTR